MVSGRVVDIPGLDTKVNIVVRLLVLPRTFTPCIVAGTRHLAWIMQITMLGQGT